MATPEETRRRLEEQANRRVNPLLKGLSMLTGGIAGEFTGTNEQIRQQRQAKRTLMEENLAALQEECRRVEEFNRETESLDRRLAALRHQEECRRMEEFRLETESLDRRLAALRAHENKRRAGNV